MPRQITVKSKDTALLGIVVSATDEDGVKKTSLAGLASAKLYLCEKGSTTLVVNGSSLSTVSSPNLILGFNPVGAKVGGGNPLDVSKETVLEGHVLLDWGAAGETRHPDVDELLEIVITVRKDP